MTAVASALQSSGPLVERHRARVFLAARDTLSEFIAEQAQRVTAEVGFGYVAQADAPDTYARLCAAYARSSGSGEPLAVSDANSDLVAYTSAEVNFALRFIHDVAHVQKRLTFSLPDELELALWHLSELADAGLGPDTTVWKLLHSDLLGSVYVMSLGNRFPGDQAAFGSRCLVHGFDNAVLAEVRKGGRGAWG